MESPKTKLIDIECEIRSNRPDDAAIAIATGATELRKYKGGIQRQSEKWFWLWKDHTEINDDGTVTIPEWLALQKGLI